MRAVVIETAGADIHIANWGSQPLFGAHRPDASQKEEQGCKCCRHTKRAFGEIRIENHELRRLCAELFLEYTPLLSQVPVRSHNGSQFLAGDAMPLSTQDTSPPPMPPCAARTAPPQSTAASDMSCELKKSWGDRVQIVVSLANHLSEHRANSHACRVQRLAAIAAHYADAAHSCSCSPNCTAAP